MKWVPRACFIATTVSPVWGQDFVPAGLFNLDVDPVELNNLVDDENYLQLIKNFTARIQEFAAQRVDPVLPTQNDGALFSQVGGYVPFIDYSNPPPKPDVTAVTPRPGAPNIAFVLLDGKCLAQPKSAEH